MDVLRTSVGPVPESQILDHIGTSSKCLKETFSRHREGMSLGVTYRTIWDVLRTLHWDGCPQDVVFQRPEDVGKGRPQGVGMR